MGENRRNWIGGRDAHIHAIEPGPYQGRLIDAAVVVFPSPVTPCDVGVAPRLQAVVLLWVCQCNFSRLDDHRCPAQ